MNIPRGGLNSNDMAKLQNLLPPLKSGKRGRPYGDHRTIINGILWSIRTGAPWRDLPERFGSWNTVYSRFHRWENSGLWQKLLASIMRLVGLQGGIDWELHHADSTVIRAHKHSAGARITGPNKEERTPQSLAIGKSRGGFSTKVHIRVDNTGKPMVIVLTQGQRNDKIAFEDLMKGGKVRGQGRGRPRHLPKALAADKQYRAKRIQRYLRKKKIKCVIPPVKTERRRGPFDREAYKERNIVERSIGRAKENRRLATRYEKLNCTYLAMWLIASIVMWLRDKSWGQ